MKTDNFNEIIFNKPKNWNKVITRQKDAYSLDTETLNGKAFLLGDSEKNYLTCNVENLRVENIDTPLDNFETMLNGLLSNKNTLNTFFNLSYDQDALLKHLSLENLKMFAQLGYTIFNGFYISGIPKKSIDLAKAILIDNIVFSNDRYNITLDNGTVKKYKKMPRIFYDLDKNMYMLEKKVKFFDVWQFFKYEKKSSLDACAQKYLGACKDDIEFFGYNKANLPLDNAIIAYCNKDSELTKRLTDIIINACNDIGLTFNTPYSCATISSDFFFINESLKNPYMFLWQYGNTVSNKNKSIFERSYYAYKGGRTEVCKRGYFEESHIYDVNSMYPTQMCTLYDIYSCNWVYIRNDKEFKEIDKSNIAYAFLNCDINLKDSYVNCLPFKHNGYYIYGHGIFNNYNISMPEYDMITNLNLGDINIKSGWIGIKTGDSKEYYPFKDVIEKTFNKRNTFPKTDFRNALLKIILNSIYGRFIEVNINKDLDSEIDLMNDNYVITDTDIYKKVFLAGKYFCPPYACNITSLSRCMLYEEIFKNEPEHNFIGSFTDSILSKEKLNGVPVSKKLGDWDYEHGELTIVGSGVYRLEIDNADDKLRTRGIHIKESLNDMFGYNGIGLDEILINGVNQTKVKKLKESLIQNTPNDFNTFVEQHKTVNLNFDKKRNWNFDLLSLQDVYREGDSKSKNINELVKK